MDKAINIRDFGDYFTADLENGGKCIGMKAHSRLDVPASSPMAAQIEALDTVEKVEDYFDAVVAPIILKSAGKSW